MNPLSGLHTPKCRTLRTWVVVPCVPLVIIVVVSVLVTDLNEKYFRIIIIRWPKPIITPRAYRRFSNTTADTALPPTRHRHHRQRHRYCHRSAGRSCLYVERAPSPLLLHVVASWEGTPSSLRGKDLTGQLSLILSDAVWLGVTAVLVGGEV
jgi:hypothetical protein